MQLGAGPYAAREGEAEQSAVQRQPDQPYRGEDGGVQQGVVTGVFGFVYFGLLNTGVATIIFLAIVVSLVPHDMMYGPQAALIAESFTGRLRYSGSSLGYQLASVIAGGELSMCRSSVSPSINSVAIKCAAASVPIS